MIGEFFSIQIENIVGEIISSSHETKKGYYDVLEYYLNSKYRYDLSVIPKLIMDIDVMMSDLCFYNYLYKQ